MSESEAEDDKSIGPNLVVDQTVLTKVRVKGNYRVVHEGIAYVGGDTLEIPGDKLNQWIAAGWVEKLGRKK